MLAISARGSVLVIRIPTYQIDAFTNAVFHGNPAAVCLLSNWLPDTLLQAIATENNLSETAFVLADRDPVPVRWFTPTEEVPLCGHATLAAGFVVLNFLAPDRNDVTFTSTSGLLHVSRSGDGFSMEFPKIDMERVGKIPGALRSGLGMESLEVWCTKADPNYLVILDDEAAVAGLWPNLDRLACLHPYGVAVSAPGTSVDFVSRYFAPGYGIPEDPVTGSIHCSLGPYWSERLGRRALEARQLSARGGHIRVAIRAGGVQMRGDAVCYLTGEIYVPA